MSRELYYKTQLVKMSKKYDEKSERLRESEDLLKRIYRGEVPYNPSSIEDSINDYFGKI